MSEEIIKVLDNLGERFGIAINWSSENVMPYLQELAGRFIAYRNGQAIIAIIVSIIVIIITCIIIKKLNVWRKSEDFDDDCFSDDKAIFNIFMTCCIFAIVISSIVIIANLVGIVQNIYMPELTILNYIRNFNI